MSGVYWVLTCGGYQGTQEFDSEVDAIMRALELSKATGQLWVPRRMYY